MAKNATRRPVIGVTMGDPLGVGAEIVVRALSDPELRRRARFVIFGFSEQLSYTADQLEVPFGFHRDRPESIRPYAHDLVVLDYDWMALPPTMRRGSSRLGGEASFAFCEDAIAATREGLVDALVTAPISKRSWQLAKVNKKFHGHTELLADRCGARHVAMMFVSPQLRVVLATIHEGLMSLRDKFTIGCVYNPIELADRALREWWGIDRPRLGVAGLNPHAGEDGQFGDEEQRVIAPAIVMAGENGVDVEGPFPADTLFVRAAAGQFDCVVAMYHDQGLIPIKLLGWEEAVNVTLGLPIIRTSPDHGTAFDIAGKLKARPGSMLAATRLAIELAERRIGLVPPADPGDSTTEDSV
ncbi:MAG: 4-hydroxythreonine-4-phosphate dehydrogenase PdxA [Planctomycetes bacterium]|jgi:4-hydroxythreonine-4-phosphate dehydrogenase|nr:4-hydroxythreonine-4-phosphate dehydrogenase PdxA [Planctomycetota bacterium]